MKKLKPRDAERLGNGNKLLRMNLDLNSVSLILGPLCFPLAHTERGDSGLKPVFKEAVGGMARVKVPIIHSGK